MQSAEVQNAFIGFGVEDDFYFKGITLAYFKLCHFAGSDIRILNRFYELPLLGNVVVSVDLVCGSFREFCPFIVCGISAFVICLSMQYAVTPLS